MVKVTLQKFLFWQGHVYESRLASISDSRSLRFVHLNILKNSSFIFSRSRSSLPAPPLESGCKGKACFSISKFFQAFFQTFFPAPRFNLFPLAPSLSKAGAKIRQSFPFFQIFSRLFFKFFPLTTARAWLEKR